MDHSVASRHRWLENQGKRAAQQERSHSDLKDVNYEGTLVKAPPRMRTPDMGRRKPVECSRKNGYCKDGTVREQQRMLKRGDR